MPSRLIEHIPDDLVARWRNTSVFWSRLVIGGILALWVPLGVALAWLPYRRGTESVQWMVLVITGLTLSLAWLLVVYFAGCFTRNRWTKSRLPVIELDAAVLTLTWNRETIEASVVDCNLRRGRAWQMKHATRKAKRVPFGDRDLILIDFPPLYRDILGLTRSYTTVAVGYTVAVG
ncbi:hypothetical protein CA13_11100 [Planctomycetes bacterium CA13]|uniref:Uncharacterized protein n=1 Tax=Novipirellula herctigrandis TaxID=2527986 RepID=A0A5C5YZ68_9BACT|nr:hypothetical protein CA13_11100 [Planctomycetes bacterium CA13]